MKADSESMEFKIPKAAEKLFLEQGYAKTTMGQIAKLAGCNQALVHYYYRTKDNLFDKIFKEKMRLVVAQLPIFDSTVMPIEDKVAELVSVHFDFLRDNPNIVLFVLNELSSNPDRLKTLAVEVHPRAFFETLNEALQAAAAQGTIQPITSYELMITVLSLNIMPFLLTPVLQGVLNLSDKQLFAFQEQRKAENIRTILARLKP